MHPDAVAVGGYGAVWSSLLKRLRRNRLSLGERGERQAARFLRREGYLVLERGFRTVHGEVDLIVTDRRAVVFVEVKTRASDRYEHPAEAVDRAKQRRIASAAADYVARHHLNDTPLRFDIVAIVWPPKQRTPKVQHIIGAFDVAEW